MQEVILYRPLDDLGTRISVHIERVIPLVMQNLSLNKDIREKKEVPKLLSIINSSAADNKTGKETTPIIAVTKMPISLREDDSWSYLLSLSSIQ